MERGNYLSALPRRKMSISLETGNTSVTVVLFERYTNDTFHKARGSLSTHIYSSASLLYIYRQHSPPGSANARSLSPPDVRPPHVWLGPWLEVAAAGGGRRCSNFPDSLHFLFFLLLFAYGGSLGSFIFPPSSGRADRSAGYDSYL